MEKRIANVDDDIPTYGIVGKISKPNIAFEGSEDKVGPLHTTNELMEAQANNVLCLNLKRVLEKDRSIIINKDSQLCRKTPADWAIPIVVAERDRRTLLYPLNWPTLAERSGTRRMYDAIRQT